MLWTRTEGNRVITLDDTIVWKKAHTNIVCRDCGGSLVGLLKVYYVTVREEHRGWVTSPVLRVAVPSMYCAGCDVSALGRVVGTSLQLTFLRGGAALTVRPAGVGQPPPEEAAVGTVADIVRRYTYNEAYSALAQQRLTVLWTFYVGWKRLERYGVTCLITDEGQP